MSKNIYAQFGTNESLETGGIVLNFGTIEVDGKTVNIDIRVARAGGHNSKFTRVSEVVLKPYRRQIMNESIEPSVLEALFRKIYAQAVVIGWSGITDREGNLLEFNEENCVKVFTDLPDLFKDVREAAEKATLFRDQKMEAEAGN